jgi:hypothetical protein
MEAIAKRVVLFYRGDAETRRFHDWERENIMSRRLTPINADRARITICVHLRSSAAFGPLFFSLRASALKEPAPKEKVQ